MTINPISAAFTVAYNAEFVYNGKQSPAPVLNIIANVKPNQATINVQEDTCEYIVSLTYMKTYFDVEQCVKDIKMLDKQIEFMRYIQDNILKAKNAIEATKTIAESVIKKTPSTLSNYP